MSQKPNPKPVVSINHVGLHAADPKHSLQWFRRFFGFPIVARQGDTTILRVGSGNASLVLFDLNCPKAMK